MLTLSFCGILSLYVHTELFAYHKYVIAKILLSAMISLYTELFFKMFPFITGPLNGHNTLTINASLCLGLFIVRHASNKNGVDQMQISLFLNLLLSQLYE